ncbi:MAG: 50S ribosomal protein L10 [Oscillospiraceae bacterium]|jgi:large subunit ribosomal protein L10|nr:50S ribosomal protein L10 [Oscillospiraceae bacterium]
MASDKVMKAKQAEVAALSDRIQKSVTGVLVEYKGINVADDTKLRKELREAGVEYSVVKNTMLNLAAKDAHLDGLDDFLKGSTALATSNEDYAAAARILSAYASKSKFFKVKTAYVDGRVISDKQIDALAKLPSREILLATVCNAFQAPIAAFARAIQAVVDKANGPAEETAPEAAPAEA